MNLKSKLIKSDRKRKESILYEKYNLKNDRKNMKGISF